MQTLSLNALKLLQKRVLSTKTEYGIHIIFHGGEQATNLIIANIKVLSHDNSNSHSFSLDGHEFGAWIHH